VVVELVEVNVHDSIPGNIMGHYFPTFNLIQIVGLWSRNFRQFKLRRSDIGLLGCTVFLDPGHYYVHIVHLIEHYNTDQTGFWTYSVVPTFVDI
jgi:hypothetical protein